ncbi:gamma-butyrobetaine dioxygenase-like [Patiria miniata]|uniref:Gamma-butyrobetaine dioxygenase n=1 Tax=Patiria miniata TaxID=46514 RepID=A0A913YY12_PATMI|nr:gamma-butyrobetaine dioxygenase-like [Patiria miniata]
MATFFSVVSGEIKMPFRMMSSTFCKFLSPIRSRTSFARSTVRVSTAGPGGINPTSLGVAPYKNRSMLPSFSLFSRTCSTQSTTAYFAPPTLKRKEALLDDYGFKLNDVKMDDIKVDIDNKQLLVSWTNGKTQIYPFVWLRDNCRCSECFHPEALNRLIQLHQIDVDVVAKSVDISPNGKTLTIHWEGDGHQSQFPSNWLLLYRFEDSHDDRLLNPKVQFWGSDVDFRRFDFGDLLADDGALYDWLTELVTLGIAVVKDAPRELGQLQKLAARVAFIRPFVYGLTCHVKSPNPNPLHSAYTTVPMAMHTDIAYYMREAGIVMLHCIQEAEGTDGESLISDGFKVALDLKRADPEAFQLLSKYQFEFFDTGREDHGEFHTHARHKTIKLDDRGEIEAVAFSDHSRDAMLRVPVNKVLPIYRALSKFYDMLLASENCLKYKLKAGEIMTLNNQRALHGRSAFQGSRHLEVGYMEWDEVNSRIRVLAKNLQNQP